MEMNTVSVLGGTKRAGLEQRRPQGSFPPAHVAIMCDSNSESQGELDNKLGRNTLEGEIEQRAVVRGGTLG